MEKPSGTMANTKLYFLFICVLSVAESIQQQKWVKVVQKVVKTNFKFNATLDHWCQWTGRTPFCHSDCDSDEMRNELYRYDKENFLTIETVEKGHSKMMDGVKCLMGKLKYCCVIKSPIGSRFWKKYQRKIGGKGLLTEIDAPPPANPADDPVDEKVAEAKVTTEDNDEEPAGNEPAEEPNDGELPIPGDQELPDEDNLSGMPEAEESNDVPDAEGVKTPYESNGVAVSGDHPNPDEETETQYSPPDATKVNNTAIPEETNADELLENADDTEMSDETNPAEPTEEAIDTESPVEAATDAAEEAIDAPVAGNGTVEPIKKPAAPYKVTNLPTSNKIKAVKPLPAATSPTTPVGSGASPNAVNRIENKNAETPAEAAEASVNMDQDEPNPAGYSEEEEPKPYETPEETNNSSTPVTDTAAPVGNSASPVTDTSAPVQTNNTAATTAEYNDAAAETSTAESVYQGNITQMPVNSKDGVKPEEENTLPQTSINTNATPNNKVAQPGIPKMAADIMEGVTKKPWKKLKKTKKSTKKASKSKTKD